MIDPDRGGGAASNGTNAGIGGLGARPPIRVTPPAEVDAAVRRRLRSLLHQDIARLRVGIRGRDEYLQDVTTKRRGVRSVPADVCLMRDADDRSVIEVVFPIATRDDWSTLMERLRAVEPWEAVAHYVSVAAAERADAPVTVDEVPAAWGLCSYNSRESGFLYDIKEPPLLRPPTRRPRLTLWGPDGKRIS